MPDTTTYRRGQVVVVSVPFSTQEGAKPRPAVIVSAETFHRALPDVIVCPVSSQPWFYQRPGPGDCPLQRWRALGLRYPSTVRVSNILAVDKQLIKRALGALAAEDRERLVETLRHALGL
jgi:mRNA-degrading endonuclease toxin of MazEF toxin-antitoxin module